VLVCAGVGRGVESSEIADRDLAVASSAEKRNARNYDRTVLEGHRLPWRVGGVAKLSEM
jgi:hypothetical protein